MRRLKIQLLSIAIALPFLRCLIAVATSASVIYSILLFKVKLCSKLQVDEPFWEVDLTPPVFHVGLLIRYEEYDVTFLIYSLCLLSQMLYVVSLVLFASPFLFLCLSLHNVLLYSSYFLQPVEDDLKINLLIFLLLYLRKMIYTFEQ